MRGPVAILLLVALPAPIAQNSPQVPTQNPSQGPSQGPAQGPTPPQPQRSREVKLDVHGFKVLENYSGPTSYYRLVEDPAEPFIRALYRPPLETVTLGIEVPEQFRRRILRLRWKWRALVLPKGGDECRENRGDSAAVVYVSWKRGLKWYSIKYVWSSEGQKGRTCDQKRNLFVGQDTVILETDGPLNVWKVEEVDPTAEFRDHFEGGNPNAEVPDLVGLGIMSDGDQTGSISAADYTGFTLIVAD